MADNLNLSRLGQNLTTSDGSWAQDNALFLKVATGEVLTVYNNTTIMKGLHRERTIQHGKSAAFHATGRAAAKYHKPGEAILGDNKIPHTEVVINVDDFLVASVTIADIDELKADVNTRGEYTKQLGIALAEAYDKNLLQLSILGARSGPRIPGEAGGSSLTDAGFANDGLAIAKGMFQAASLFDEKNVPQNQRYIILRPAQFYLMASTTELLNKDWGGSGTYSDGTITKIAGIEIKTSNLVPNAIVTATAGQNNKYDGNFANVIGTCFHTDALGTVKLKDLTTAITGGDFNTVYLATLLTTRYAMGHGVLRSECCIEFAKA